MARPIAVRSIVKSFGNLSFEQQKEALNQLRAVHELSRSAKRAPLKQLRAKLGSGAPKRAVRAKALKKASGLAPEKPQRAAKRNGKRASVKAKYRDRKTGETWSGRGRMARWLKAKQDAGEKIDKYLLN